MPGNGTSALGRAALAPLTPLLVVLAALAAVVLIPNLYSDVNGLDPYQLRASGVALALLAVVFLMPGLARARLMLVGIVTITLSWSAFQATPQLLADLGVRQTGDQAGLYSSVAWFAVTAAVLLLVRLAPRDARPRLRLLHFGWPAAAVAAGGILLFLLVTLAIPAGLLGREGFAIPALARDSVWLVPANMLQAAAQELQFRGLLLGSLERLTGPLAANLAQSAVFALAHLAIVYQGPEAPLVVITAFLGFLLGLATQRTNSLWPAMAVHMVADVAVFAAVLPGLYGF
ncbi:MAG: CPBP family intramembrane glutamic endopeptidase [Candidatus Dormibacteria bacterium]|jgi:membrane protease YdiL (CAAX protease family)